MMNFEETGQHVLRAGEEQRKVLVILEANVSSTIDVLQPSRRSYTRSLDALTILREVTSKGV